MDSNDEKPMAQRINWFGPERPTDTGGGTVWVKPGKSDGSQEPAAQ